MRIANRRIPQPKLRFHVGIQLLRATGASTKLALHCLSARLTGLLPASLMMGTP
jgi:hypothetical protein